MPKKIDPAVKQRAVRLVAEHEAEYPNRFAAIVAVAKQVGVSQESVRRWVSQAEIDSGQRSGFSSDELAEIKRLKAENKQLREHVQILKAATTFFAGELDPRNR
jgi:transposase